MKTSIIPVTPNTYLIHLIIFNLYHLGFIKFVCDLYKVMVSKRVKSQKDCLIMTCLSKGKPAGGCYNFTHLVEEGGTRVVGF